MHIGWWEVAIHQQCDKEWYRDRVLWRSYHTSVACGCETQAYGIFKCRFSNDEHKLQQIAPIVDQTYELQQTSSLRHTLGPISCLPPPKHECPILVLASALYLWHPKTMVTIPLGC